MKKYQDFLNKCKEFIVKNNYNVYDIAIASNFDDIEVEKIKDIDFLPNSYSVAKAWVVCACGLLYDEGKLDLNESITAILKPYINYPYDAIWDTITVHDALKHRIGLEPGYLDIDVEDPRNFGDDFIRYVLQSEQSKNRPKIDFVYTDAAFYLLSRIVAEKAGMDLKDYLKIKVFDIVGIDNYTWETCPYGYSMGATGLHMNSVDTIKLPLLILNNGLYHDIRILSLDWIKVLETNQYENYYFKDNGWYQKAGMYGQIIMYNRIINKAVSWHAGEDITDKVRNFVIDYFKQNNR